MRGACFNLLPVLLVAAAAGLAAAGKEPRLPLHVWIEEKAKYGTPPIVVVPGKPFGSLGSQVRLTYAGTVQRSAMVVVCALQGHVQLVMEAGGKKFPPLQVGHHRYPTADVAAAGGGRVCQRPGPHQLGAETRPLQGTIGLKLI